MSKLYLDNKKDLWQDEADELKELQDKYNMVNVVYSNRSETFINMKKKLIKKEIDTIKTKIKNKIILSMNNVDKESIERFYV